MKKIAVLTGAGVSADSGLSTFRDSGGLWEGYDVMEVASIQGWHKNKQLVLDFYNQRRRQLKDAKPNAAHIAIAELEKKFDVTVITQNVDDLHERAGSSKIIHLHGELTKARSSMNEHLVKEIGYEDINIGDKCEHGSQIRPHIVWFGEMVPKIAEAAEVIENTELLIIVGTSLVVYPAAGLIEYAPYTIPKYIVDPVKPDLYKTYPNLELILSRAKEGMPDLTMRLLNDFS